MDEKVGSYWNWQISEQENLDAGSLNYLIFALVSGDVELRLFFIFRFIFGLFFFLTFGKYATAEGFDVAIIRTFTTICTPEEFFIKLKECFFIPDRAEEKLLPRQIHTMRTNISLLIKLWISEQFNYISQPVCSFPFPLPFLLLALSSSFPCSSFSFLLFPFY